ncbi:hypothetical protein [Acinetobacter guerrae]|uniref:hypothetical protein n=1 Tax=Acinetobacter guerrae TaxID=1843371 RepID=UPI00125ED479|nr:hypothetical protein [Acinetobacter guerrae]
MKSLRKQKKRFSLKEHKAKDNPKPLGQMIGNAVRNIIKSEQRQGGLLYKNNIPKDSDVSTTTIEDCRLRTTEMKLQWGNPKDEQP